MHDYYRIIFSESLIFLGFSMLSEIDLMGVIWRGNVTKLKNSKNLDFTRFQDATTVFLTMYRENNHKKLPNYA